MFTAIAIGGAALVGAGASIYAANKQSKAAGKAGEQSMAQYRQTRSDLMPWANTGGQANSRLAYLLGIDGANGIKAPTRADAEAQVLREHIAQYGEGYGKYSDMGKVGSREDSVYKNLLSDYESKSAAAGPPTDSAYGSLTKNFTGADLQNEPGYQFGQQQGQLAIDRAASAAGRYDSGDTLKALTRFGNDYAGTKYNEAFNRDSTNKSRTYGFLTGVSNTGENAAAQTGAFGANAANSSGNFLTGGADASAAGLIGASNSLSGGVGNYLQYNQNQATLNYLKGLRNGGIGNGWGSPAPTAGYGAQG